MADITKRAGNDDCCEEGERGERGERGKRGPRGHDGHHGKDGRDGDPGSTGPTGPGSTAPAPTSLLKFSGSVPFFGEAGPAVNYLADQGSNSPVVFSAPAYPVALASRLRNLAVNIYDYQVPNGTILVQLLQDGSPVPGFEVTFVAGDSGIKSVLAGPTPYAIESTFDLRVTVNVDESAARILNLSATVGMQ